MAGSRGTVPSARLDSRCRAGRRERPRAAGRVSDPVRLVVPARRAAGRCRRCARPEYGDRCHRGLPLPGGPGGGAVPGPVPGGWAGMTGCPLAARDSGAAVSGATDGGADGGATGRAAVALAARTSPRNPAAERVAAGLRPRGWVASLVSAGGTAPRQGMRDPPGEPACQGMRDPPGEPGCQGMRDPPGEPGCQGMRDPPGEPGARECGIRRGNRPPRARPDSPAAAADRRPTVPAWRGPPGPAARTGRTDREPAVPSRAARPPAAWGPVPTAGLRAR